MLLNHTVFTEDFVPQEHSFLTRINKGKQIFGRGLKLKYNPPTEDVPVNYFELIKNNVVKQGNDSKTGKN